MKITLRAIVTLCICLLSASCKGDAAMSCESDLHKQLYSMHKNRMTKEQVVDFLSRSNIEFMDLLSEDFHKYSEHRSEQDNLFGIIIVSVDMSSADATSTEIEIKKNELIRIGYDKDGGLIGYECKEVYTGP